VPQATADFLATVPLFRSLSREELAIFAQLVRARDYAKGSVILFEDDPGDAFFVVRSGRVKVVLTAADGREVILGILGVGDWALLLELSRRLRRADEKIGALVLLDVPGRIARLLLDHAAEGDGHLIDKPLTHQTIAHLVGASRETISRALRDFVQAGWIASERRRIRVLDREALERRTALRA